MTERPAPHLSYGEREPEPEFYTYTDERRGDKFIPHLPNNLEKIADMPEDEIAARLAAHSEALPGREAAPEKTKVQEIVDTGYIVNDARDWTVEEQALYPQDVYGLAA